MYISVVEERFEYARRLKSAMSCLREAGERMGRYELAKKIAALAEDFQKATLRKEQIEVYRRSVYKALDLDVLLEVNGVGKYNYITFLETIILKNNKLIIPNCLPA